VTIRPLESIIHPEPAPWGFNVPPKTSRPCKVVLMATTEGLILATAETKSGIVGGVWVSNVGSTKAGLIGEGVAVGDG
jgi:hypothetical protein